MTEVIESYSVCEICRCICADENDLRKHVIANHPATPADTVSCGVCAHTYKPGEKFHNHTPADTGDSELREVFKNEAEALLKDYLKDNLDNWHVKPTPERIEDYLRFHMPGYTREQFAKLADAYANQLIQARDADKMAEWKKNND